MSMVFSIVNKVVAPRSNLVDTRTLSTGFKVLSKHKPTLCGLQGTGCKGTRIIHTCALQEGLGGINDNLWGHCKSMLASMTISLTLITISPRGMYMQKLERANNCLHGLLNLDDKQLTCFNFGSPLEIQPSATLGGVTR